MRYEDNHGWQLYDYFQWLCEKVECPESMDYSLLLKDLHSIVFEVHVERDSNRALDGVNLRHEYMDEENLSDYLYLDDRQCSVLEMMIAMCVDFAIYTVGIHYGPPAYWFWQMVKNLGLDTMTDDNYCREYVEQQINQMVDRRYKRNGEGGMFPMRYPHGDQRKTELWYQMTQWFAERQEYGSFKG